MPVVAALFIRTLIQSAVTTVIFMAADWIISPLTDKAKSAVARAYGVSDEEAEDLLANEIIDAFAMIGILGIAIKSKLPTVVAEKLRFTSKGYSKRPVSPKVPKSDVGSIAKEISETGAKVAITTTEATAAVSTIRATAKGAGKAFDFLSGKLNTVFLGFLVVGGFIDFGNWETGAYSDFFQKLFAKITFGLLVPNEDWRKTKTASPEVFTKVYETYKTAGAIGINDPFKLMTVAFTRDNLIDVVDKVGAASLLATGSASTKEILLGTQLFIIFDKNSYSSSVISPTTQVPSPTVSTTTTTSTPKVFTGIVSQGVVGKGLVFESRPDDLIESKAELLQAAANNLTPFLNTLLGKIVYEVKVVPSIITKEGFKQTGITQQIRTGTFADGNPKYKTVTNKFATLTVYALTDKGSRAKLTTIVLGPTNSAKLTINTNDLRSVETELPSLVTTTNIDEIIGIETASPVTVSTPASAGGKPTLAPVTSPSGQPAVSSNATLPSTALLGDTATTLFDWYQAQGLALPNVATRSDIYESLGLGLKTYYTGTAEQNTKLLSALKDKARREADSAREAARQAQSASSSASDNKSGSGSDSGAVSDKTLPRVNKADITGKVVKRTLRKQDGSYIITYDDNSTRTWKPAPATK